MGTVLDYTYTANTNTITITEERFIGLKIEQILSITNLSKKKPLYISSNPSLYGFYIISITNNINNCVIVLNNPNSSFSDSDIIQILVDDSIVDVNITNSAIVGSSDLLTVYSSQSVAVSSTIESTAKDIRNVSYADIFIKNETGTNTTVNIYGSPDTSKKFESFVGTTTLNASSLTQDSISISHCPNYLFFEIINNDPSNAAVIDISIQRTVLSDVVRPFSDTLEVYSEESVATSTTINSTAQDIRGASYVIPYVKNATSTDLTVNIYGSYNSTGTIKTLVRSYSLNTVTDQAGDPITKPPNYLFFETINDDPSNAATVDISVMRR